MSALTHGIGIIPQSAGNITYRKSLADTFRRQVSDLELQGHVARRETYRVTQEVSPETGRIVHPHTVEMRQAGPDEAV